MIVWRGWGFLVMPVAFAAWCIGSLTGLVAGSSPGTGMAIGSAVTGILGGIGCYFLARWLEGKPHTVVDPSTGQPVTVAGDGGAFMFLRVRYWAWVLPAVGLLLAIAYWFDPPR